MPLPPDMTWQQLIATPQAQARAQGFGQVWDNPAAYQDRWTAMRAQNPQLGIMPQNLAEITAAMPRPSPVAQPAPQNYDPFAMSPMRAGGMNSFYGPQHSLYRGTPDQMIARQQGVNDALALAGVRANPVKKKRATGGMVNHAGGGRADDVDMTVPNDSYVLPADVVSALGEGNSMAGAEVLNGMFPAEEMEMAGDVLPFLKRNPNPLNATEGARPYSGGSGEVMQIPSGRQGLAERFNLAPETMNKLYNSLEKKGIPKEQLGYHLERMKQIYPDSFKGLQKQPVLSDRIKGADIFDYTPKTQTLTIYKPHTQTPVFDGKVAPEKLKDLVGPDIASRILNNPTWRFKGPQGPYSRYSPMHPDDKGRAFGGRAPGVDIAISGGEFLIDPKHVMRLGNGDAKQGHAALDQFVKAVRGRNIKTLKNLPGPAK